MRIERNEINSKNLNMIYEVIKITNISILNFFQKIIEGRKKNDLYGYPMDSI